jgi:hypothetical protein
MGWSVSYLWKKSRRARRKKKLRGKRRKKNPGLTAVAEDDSKKAGD